MGSERSGPTVFVLGAYGYFGRLLVRDLLEMTQLPRISAVGRHPVKLRQMAARLRSHGDRFHVEVADLRNLSRLGEFLHPGDVVVDCAGPFQKRDLAVLGLCVERRCHFIDIADAREYLRAVYDQRSKLVGASSVILSGLSVLPGLVVLLARRAAALMDRVESVLTWLAPGNRGPREYGTVYSLIHSLGEPLEVLSGGRRREALPWSEPRSVRFPDPIRLRTGYLAVGVDTDILPVYFPGLRTAEFRIAAELDLLNRATGLLAPMVRRAPGVFQAAVPLLRTGMAAFGCLGTEAGGVLVRVEGSHLGARKTAVLSVVREKRSPVIAIVLASLAAQKIAQRAWKIPWAWTPLDQWLSQEELVRAYALRRCTVQEEILGIAAD